MAARITQVGILAVLKAEPRARVTQIGVAVALQATNTRARVTQTGVSVFIRPGPATADYLGSHTDAGDWTA